MNDLQVVVSQEVGKIDFNFEEIKAGLQERMALYDGATFTEESKTIAKAEVAALRKMKSAVDQTRKDVKTQCLAPYKDFEEKAKELMALIDAPINLIDGQVKVFEEARRAEKREKILDFYKNAVGDMAEYVPFEKVYDAKWENASRSMKSVEEDILMLIDSAKMAVETIQSMTSDKVPDALAFYKLTQDMAGAIKMINDYERQKAEIIAKEHKRREEEEARRRAMEEEKIRQQERERVAEEERIRQEERAKAEAALSALAENAKAEPDVEPSGFDVDDDLPFEQPDMVTSFFRIVGTVEELEAVEVALDSIGVYFERRDQL